MVGLREVIHRLDDVKHRVEGVTDVLPTTQGPTQHYESAVLHAGSESLRLINRLSSGEKMNLHPITSTQASLESYIESMLRDQLNPANTGSYVVIEINRQKFLGISNLIKRELTIAELRELYRVDAAYPDQVIIDAKQQGQLEMTTDVGVQVRFSMMPLAAITEVASIGTKNSKLAAHAIATNIMTSPAASNQVQRRLEDDCHDHQPGLSLTDTHYITPMAIALSAATEAGALDNIITATTMTTAALHGDLSPTLASVMHMHDASESVARKQAVAVGETGLIGGVPTQDLAFWLQGWERKINGVSQPDLRSSFRLYEILPENSLATRESLAQLSSDEKLELTVVTGAALTAPSSEKLEAQVLKLSDQRNLFEPVSRVFKPQE